MSIPTGIDPSLDFSGLCILFEKVCELSSNPSYSNQSEALLAQFHNHPQTIAICKECYSNTNSNICKFTSAKLFCKKIYENWDSYNSDILYQDILFFYTYIKNNLSTVPTYVYSESLLVIGHILKRLWYNSPSAVSEHLFNELLVSTPFTKSDPLILFSLDLLYNIILAFTDNNKDFHIPEGRLHSCQQAFTSYGLKNSYLYSIQSILFSTNQLVASQVKASPTDAEGVMNMNESNTITLYVQKSIQLFNALLRWPWINVLDELKSQQKRKIDNNKTLCERITPPRDYEFIITDKSLIEALFKLYSSYRIKNASISASIFDSLYLLLNMDSSSYNSSQTHALYIYTILEYLYKLILTNIQLVEQVNETDSILYDDNYIYIQKENDRIAMLLQFLLCSKYTYILINSDNWQNILFLLKNWFHLCISKSVYASHHMSEDDCFLDMFDDYNSISINILDILSYFCLDDNISISLGNLPCEIYALYLDGQLSLSHMALLQSDSSKHSAIDRYLEREEIEASLSIDDASENISILGRMNIQYTCDLLSQQLKMLGTLLTNGGNENDMCIVSEKLYILYTFINGFIANKNEIDMPCEFSSFLQPNSSFLSLLSFTYNTILSLYAYQEKQLFYISPLLTQAIFTYINIYITIYGEYFKDSLVSIISLSITALSYMADEEDSFVCICVSLHTLIEYFYKHKQTQFDYSLVSKLVDSFMISLDLSKKHHNEQKYYLYIYDINDKQWLYLSNIVFSLPLVFTHPSFTIESLLLSVQNVFSSLVSTNINHLQKLLAEPKYIYQIIQLYNIMRGLIYSTSSNNPACIHFLLSSLDPSLELYDALREYEEITNILLKYFNNLSRCLDSFDVQSTNIYINAYTSFCTLYKKNYKQKFEQSIDTIHIRNLNKIINTILFIFNNSHMTEALSPEENYENTILLYQPLCTILPLMTPTVLTFPQLAADFYSTISTILSMSLYSLCSYQYFPASIDWNMLSQVILYGLQCYDCEQNAIDCILEICDTTYKLKDTNQHTIIQQYSCILQQFLLKIFEFLLTNPSTKQLEAIEERSGEIFLLITAIDSTITQNIFNSILMSQNDNTIKMKLSELFLSLFNESTNKKVLDKFTRWGFHSIFKNFCYKVRLLLEVV